MNKYEVIHSFWNSFGIPAYEENTIPKAAALPYITYELQTDNFEGNQVALSAHIWDKSNSWKYLNGKTEEIAEALKNARLKCDSGYIMLYAGSPFSNNSVSELDSTVKGKYLNITADFITL